MSDDFQNVTQTSTAKHVSDCPTLQAVLEQPRITYLFGAGMSSALSSNAVGWVRWLQAGIDYLPDPVVASSLQTRLFPPDEKMPPSADELISLCSHIISACKEANVYHDWMKSAIEAPTLENTALAQILQKMSITRDTLTTTNYDSLLEQATHLPSLTYEQPGQILEQLQRGDAAAVVHLHGMYNSVLGIDNIIADEDQYNSLFENEGAQFIQHLFSTTPLLFVGCGLTVEDQNIVRLIRFMRDHLNLTVPYIFLKRRSEQLDMPSEDIVTVDYGDNYSDLPLFLEEMVDYRIAHFLRHHPIIGQLPVSNAAANTLGKYHFTSQNLDFVGRETELYTLNDFLSGDIPFQWWAVTGQSGSGKSRLVWEWMKQCPRRWYPFFLNAGATVEDAQSFTPFSDTIIAVDNLFGQEQRIATVLCTLLRQFDSSPYRLRIVLLERENARGFGSWYERFHTSMTSDDQIRFSDAQYTDFLELTDLSDDAITALIAQICRQNNLPSDHLRDQKLRQEYWEKFEQLHYRPLFVQLYVEAWIANGYTDPRYASFDAVLQQALLREQDRWLTLFQGDKQLCSALIRLLVRAVAGGGLKLDSLPPEYAADWQAVRSSLEQQFLPGMQRTQGTALLLADIVHSMLPDSERLVPLYPDILQEYLFLFYIDASHLFEITDELWRNAADFFSTFLYRVLCDFQGETLPIQIVEQAPDPYHNINVLNARFAFLDWRGFVSGDKGEIIQRVEKEYKFWSAMPLEGNQYDENGFSIFSLTKYRGLCGVVQQFRAFDHIAPMMSALMEALDIPLGNGEALKPIFLSGLGRACAISGQFHVSDQIYSLISQRFLPLLDDDNLAEIVKYPLLLEKNSTLMNCLLDNNLPQGYKILKQMFSSLQMPDEEQLRLFSHSCINLAHFSFLLRSERFLDRALYYLDKARDLAPTSIPVRAYWLRGQIYRHQYNMLILNKGHDAAHAQILEIISQLEQMSLLEATCDTWAIGVTALLNTLDKSSDVDTYIRQAAEWLDIISFDGSMLAQAWITLHLFRFRTQKKIIVASIVDQAYSYVLRYPDSSQTRTAFYQLLDCSTVRDRTDRYSNPRVTAAMFHDLRYNPLYDADIDLRFLQRRNLESSDE